MKWLHLGMLLAAVLVLTACSDEGDPAKTVAKFLQARAENNEESLRLLICAEQESQLPMIVSSFAAVKATLRDLSCEKSSEDGSVALVSCDGAFVLDYGNEQTELPLSSYRVVKEDGEWKWCGEG